MFAVPNSTPPHPRIHLRPATNPPRKLRPPSYGPGSHPSREERPSSWSLLQLWQTRPHHKGLPRTTCPECPEHRCYNNSKTHSQGLAVPRGIPEGDSNSICAHNTST